VGVKGEGWNGFMFMWFLYFSMHKKISLVGSSCSMLKDGQTERHTDRQTDITRLKDAFRNYAKASKDKCPKIYAPK
jgi:hypothetical protein